MQSKLFQCVTTQRNFRIIESTIELAKQKYLDKLREDRKDDE